jgi:redox-sensitive bicupin YhaK (pirin superfamily)
MKKSDMTSSWWEQVLLIAGVPLNEPIARYGPFVMNRETEVIRRLKITVGAAWARLNLE